MEWELFFETMHSNTSNHSAPYTCTICPKLTKNIKITHKFGIQNGRDFQGGYTCNRNIFNPQKIMPKWSAFNLHVLTYTYMYMYMYMYRDRFHQIFCKI